MHGGGGEGGVQTPSGDRGKVICMTTEIRRGGCVTGGPVGGGGGGGGGYSFTPPTNTKYRERVPMTSALLTHAKVY